MKFWKLQCKYSKLSWNKQNSSTPIGELYNILTNYLRYSIVFINKYGSLIGGPLIGEPSCQTCHRNEGKQCGDDSFLH